MMAAIGFALILLCWGILSLGWIAIARFLAGRSGWHDLAAHYTSCQPAKPLCRFYWRTGYFYRNKDQLIPVSCRNMINFALCEDGLQLSTVFPFRPGHPTLFIPWANILALQTLRDKKWASMRSSDERALILGHPKFQIKLIPYDALVWDEIAQYAPNQSVDERTSVT